MADDKMTESEKSVGIFDVADEATARDADGNDSAAASDDGSEDVSKNEEEESSENDDDASSTAKKSIFSRITGCIFTLPTVWELFEIIPIAAASAVFAWSLLTEELTSEDVNYALISLSLIEVMTLLLFFNSKVLSYFSWLVVIVEPAASCMLLESMLHDVFGMVTKILALNIAFYVILAFLLLFLTRRTWVAVSVPAVLALVCGLAEYYVTEFRSSPIFPWDLRSLGTAAEVVDNYTFTMPFALSASVVGLIFIIFLAFRVHTKIKFKKPIKNFIFSAVGCVLLAATMTGYILYLNTDNVYDDFGLYRYLFTPNYMYNKNGFTAAFISNLRYIVVDKPSGYSEEALLQIYSEYESGSGDDAINDGGDREETSYPNIIMIMNEAFSDLTIYGDFETNTEIMPFIRSLYDSDDTITGWLHVSVLGGNTANTEFEALTGMSMAYLPTGSIPYQQYISDTLPTLASQLASNGYYTVSMHPYGATGWNRNKVYDYFGFKTLMFRDDFTSARIYRKYVSDSSVYSEILSTLYSKSEDSDAPYFVFAVTMQNHGSYTSTYTNFTYNRVTATGLESVTKLSQYLSLIRKSDEALSSLLTSLEAFDEDTIVVFFGDHQPATSVYSKLLELYGIELDEENSLEDMEMRYTIPFIIWSNYDIDEETYAYVSELVSNGISANYISTLVSLTAGVELTDYQGFLGTLIESFPVITANVVIDADGNYYSAYGTGDYLSSDYADDEDLLKQYAMLEYYYLFDGSGGYDFFE